VKRTCLVVSPLKIISGGVELITQFNAYLILKKTRSKYVVKAELVKKKFVISKRKAIVTKQKIKNDNQSNDDKKKEKKNREREREREKEEEEKEREKERQTDRQTDKETL
jgi:hypothetical protein